MNGVHNPSSSDIELIFLGTGTSGSVPNISCLTAPPDAVPCKTCLSTLTPEGKKNIRRNTSVVLRIPGHDGQKRTILIDVGKNFQAAALEWFPKYGLRRIDAVLITHAHADAMNGLDDLRAWTLRGVIQDHIPIYASRTTFAEVQRAFPYMVAKEHASGGGDVPEFKWHIFEDGMPITLEESGIEVMPLPVHHGRYFTPGPPKGFLPTPDTTHPPSRQSPTRELESKHLSSTHAFHPYICHAFLIQHSVLYMGDVSSVPDETWSAFTRYRSTSPSGERPLPVAVLDCLRPAPHTSHFGLREAVNAARKIGSARTYLTGFGHEIGHDEYTRVGEVLGGADINVKDLTAGEHKCLNAVEEGVNLWLRPAHDGLRVFIDGEQGIRDETYDAHE